MKSNLARVKILNNTKLHKVRMILAAVCFHDVAQLDLERREVMVSQQLGRIDLEMRVLGVNYLLEMG